MHISSAMLANAEEDFDFLTKLGVSPVKMPSGLDTETVMHQAAELRKRQEAFTAQRTQPPQLAFGLQPFPLPFAVLPNV